MTIEIDVPDSYPVDPLTRNEINDAREILEAARDIDPATRYVKIVLDEPSKDELADYEDTGTFPERRAFIILRSPVEKTTYEAVVSLDDAEVVS